MSFTATKWAWDQQGLTACSKLVLLSLADHANDTGHCWPSLDRMAERCDRDRRSIMRSLAELEAHGVIERHRSPGRKVTRYQLMLDNEQGRDAPVDTDTTGASRPGSEDSNRDEDAFQQGPGCSPTGASRPPNLLEPLERTSLSLEPVEKRARRLAGKAAREGADRDFRYGRIASATAVAKSNRLDLLTNEMEMLLEYAARSDLNDEQLIALIIDCKPLPPTEAERHALEEQNAAIEQAELDARGDIGTGPPASPPPPPYVPPRDWREIYAELGGRAAEMAQRGSPLANVLDR